MFITLFDIRIRKEILMSRKKRLFSLEAFRGESVDVIPVGFWHHFTTEDSGYGFENPEIIVIRIKLVCKRSQTRFC